MKTGLKREEVNPKTCISCNSTGLISYSSVFCRAVSVLSHSSLFSQIDPSKPVNLKEQWPLLALSAYLPLSGLTADISVSQIFSSLFIPLAWLRIWIMFVYYVVLLFPDGIILIHKNTCLVLLLNSCTKCLKGKNKQKTVK